MPTEIVLPQWGMEMMEGTVVRWLKREGDTIQEGEPLVEIETAKLETEMEATTSGVVAQILVSEGSTVPVRTPLVIIAAPGEEVSRSAGVAAPSREAAASPGTHAPPAATQGTAPGQVVPAARRLAREHGVDLSRVPGSGPGGRILLEDVQSALESPPAEPAERVQVVPAARRLAQQHGIDLAQVQGTGPRGRVLIADVERAISLQAQPAPALGAGQRVPIAGMRQTIARRMMDSLSSMAQLTVTSEADVTDAMRIREGVSRHRSEGGLSPLHLVVKATARALKEHPRMNAIQRDGEIELLEDVNVGVAVALDEGLIVTTIRGAAGKDLDSIASEARLLATRAREGTASYDDVTGATFTVTNLGAFQIDAFTPIINPPQVGILGVGRVVEKPAVHQGQIAVRSMMFLSLTFDHRVIDGAPAAQFLRDVKAYLEDPWWMVSTSGGG